MAYSDPSKRAAYAKLHYERNKAAYIKKGAVSKEAFKRKWAEFKATLKCTQCDESHPATLDFHHITRDPTNRKVHLLAANCSWKAIQEEMKKCVVLCANCHRKHHAEEHKERKRRRAKKS
jgi:hypothetical protein